MLRALMIAAFGLVPAAAATVIVVPKDQPTIQAAFDAAVSGDVIQISAGVYTEAVVAAAPDELLITGKGKVRLVAPIDGTALTIQSGGAVTFEKLRFEGPGLGLDTQGCDTLTVSKCRFQNLDAGIRTNGNDETIIEHCVFKTIRGRAVQLEGDHATLTHNRVRGAKEGLWLENCAMTVTDNNVRQATSSGMYFLTPLSDADSVVEDNVVDGCRACGIRLLPGAITTGQLSIRNNLIKNVTQGAIITFTFSGAAPSKVLVEQNTIRNAGYEGIQFLFYVGLLSLLSNDLGKIRGNGFALSSNGDVELTLAHNVVTGTGFDGVHSSIDAGTLSGNQITSCGRFGVYLSGSGSTLSGNVLLGSEVFDLYEAGGPNQVLPDNTIGSIGP